jgi:hypothetical protein
MLFYRTSEFAGEIIDCLITSPSLNYLLSNNNFTAQKLGADTFEKFATSVIAEWAGIAQSI